MINNIIDPLKVMMLCHGDEDVVTGRPNSNGAPEEDMPPVPIPITPHLTDKKPAVNAAECHSGPT